MRILPLHWYLPTVRGLLRNLPAGGRTYPFYASFKLTSRCHFGCPFCNMKQNRTPDLTTEEVKTILANLSRSPVLMTSFEGGEPLLRDDIGELLRFARSCKFYLLFTTSVRNLPDYPLEEYARYIDFLHVSIDEGHDNLALFDALPALMRLPLRVSVQSVVTRDTVDALDDKVRRCFEAGAGIVVIPAAHMNATDDVFPEIDRLEEVMLGLRRKYPDTIHTPQGYFSAYRRGACSTASIIIAPDGRLYYPCHILDRKGPDLRVTDLTGWLSSPEARTGRRVMRECERNCGWYQYYSIDSYTSVTSFYDALRPAFGPKRRQKSG